GRRVRRALHLEKLRALSRVTSLGEDTLAALGAMQRPPVITNLRRLLQMLMVDKLLVSVLAMVGASGATAPAGRSPRAGGPRAGASRAARPWLQLRRSPGR